MNPLKLLNKYHNPNSEAYRILLIHSILVTQKALKIAERLKKSKSDKKFIYQAAMLHDIGFGFPDFSGSGDSILKKIKQKKFYIGHGYWGQKILESEGLNKHARVASNHIGIGIKKEEIEQLNWPLPKIDFKPKSLEEQIISYADLFFSKNPQNLFQKETINEISKEIKTYRFAQKKLKTFYKWQKQFDSI
ncbi:MAG: HD domain-containing protein [Candidatus Moranbacteria bacterium]|nr:HD domain-containing protein [Candidatus Moranbacteria bacterium]